MENWSGVGAVYGPDGWKGRGEYSSSDGLITLSVDYGDEDYYIDAKPGYRPTDMRIVLEQARVRGLGPMDADECEPELLEDGTVRIYLALIDEPSTTMMPLQVQASRNRTLASYVVTAVLIAAVMAPSPLYALFPNLPTFGDKTAESVPARHGDPVAQTSHADTKGN